MSIMLSLPPLSPSDDKTNEVEEEEEEEEDRGKQKREGEERRG